MAGWGGGGRPATSLSSLLGGGAPNRAPGTGTTGKPAGSFGGTSNGSLYGQTPWGMDTAQAIASGAVKKNGENLEYGGQSYSWDQAKHGYVSTGAVGGGGGGTPPAGGGGGGTPTTQVPVPAVNTASPSLQGLQGGPADDAALAVGGGQEVGLNGGLGRRNPPSLQALLRSGAY